MPKRKTPSNEEGESLKDDFKDDVFTDEAEELDDAEPVKRASRKTKSKAAKKVLDDKVDGAAALFEDPLTQNQSRHFVVVQVDGGSPQEALLRPGEKARWKGQDQFILTLGNAGGVKAELNGKPQKPFGPSGKVARDIVIKR